ncbi:polysaccharide pyruvyl transferase family protein [Sphingobium sp. KCTC 72723]|uniref:polysaccharide pyruvyl transferase family protein n=1 Tax=Sphingobium sp. KCTC 72723 TaxID=2733867 RepID=UPI00165D72AF|nr:polysaccharide pyruvyl transferase family protein [Sphingobium sp. KCTC 72723]
MKHAIITNMTGARNGGCEALVASIILGLRREMSPSQLSLQLETGDRDYDLRTFGDAFDGYIESDALPKPKWTAARQSSFYRTFARFLALRDSRRWPATRAMLHADLLIATGGDVFTSDYGGFARHARVLNVGTPVALLGQTIGPFTSADRERFAASLQNVALCTVRESESFDYLASTFPQLAVEQTADVAFLLPPSDSETVRSILSDEHHFDTEGRRLIGLSVSTGILSYRADLSSDRYTKELAAFIDAANRGGASVILIPHVRERAAKNNDIYACREVLKRVKRPRDNLLLALPTLTASDYKGVIGKCEALIGARTHATIASMSQGLPTVSIAYSRKAWGIMKDYYGPKLGADLTLDVSHLSADSMAQALALAVANGPTPDTADDMKRRAACNFERLKAIIFGQSGGTHPVWTAGAQHF